MVHILRFVGMTAALTAALTPDAAGQESTAREQEAAARREGLERANERERASPIQWLDGHTGEVADVLFSPDGNRLATLGTDGAAWLWDAWTGEALGRLGVHAVADTLLLFSPDGERIAILDFLAGVVGLWDGRSAEFLAPLEIGTQVVTALCFDPRGERLVTADTAGRIQLWSARFGDPEGEAMETPSGILQTSFHPDGERLLTLHGGDGDRSVRIWKAATGELEATLAHPELDVTWAAFDAGGTRVLGHAGSRVALAWELGAPGEALVIRTGQDPGSRLDWGLGSVGSSAGYPLRFMRHRPEGSRLLATAPSGEVSLLDGRTGLVVGELDAIRNPRWTGIGPRGRRLLTLSRDETAVLWDATSGERIAVLASSDGPTLAQLATFSADGSRIATSRATVNVGPGELWPDMVTCTFEADGGELLHDLRHWTGGTHALDFDLRGRLAVGAEMGFALVSDAAAAQEGGGGQAGSGSASSLLVLEGSAVGVGGVFAKGDRFVGPTLTGESGSVGHPYRVWDARDGGTELEVLSGEDEGRLVVVGAAIPSGGFATLESRLGSDGEWTAFYQAYELPGGTPLEPVPAHLTPASESFTQTPVVHPAGDRIVTRSWIPGHAGFWRTTGRGLEMSRLIEDLTHFPISDDAELARIAAFEPKGSLLVTAHDSIIRVWDGLTGEPIGELEGHRDDVVDLAFSHRLSRGLWTPREDGTAQKMPRPSSQPPPRLPRAAQLSLGTPIRLLRHGAEKARPRGLPARGPRAGSAPGRLPPGGQQGAQPAPGPRPGHGRGALRGRRNPAARPGRPGPVGVNRRCTAAAQPGRAKDENG